MSRIGSLIGTVTVGVSGSVPAVSEPIQATTPAVTAEQQGRLVIPAGTTDSIEFGGVTNAVILKASFTDESTGSKQGVSIDINGLGNLVDTTDLVYVGDNVAGGITTVVITAPAGNNTVCKFVIAGV